MASKEAFAFALAALGAVNRWAGVLWKNAMDPNGNPLAVAVIPGARFSEQNGRTILNGVAGEMRDRS